MNLLSVENISKAFGERVILENISFGINKDQKIAFIAKNGTGKTTLLNIMAGKDLPDSGQVVFRKGIHIGFLLLIILFCVLFKHTNTLWSTLRTK